MKLKQTAIVVALASVMAITTSTSAKAEMGDFTQAENAMILGGLGVAVGEVALGAPVLAIGACMKYSCFGMWGGEEFQSDDVASWTDLSSAQQNGILALMEKHTRINCMKKGNKGVQWGQLDSHDEYTQMRKVKNAEFTRLIGGMGEMAFRVTTVYPNGKVGFEKDEYDEGEQHTLYIHSMMRATESQLAHRGVSCLGIKEGNSSYNANYSNPMEVWVEKNGDIKMRNIKNGRRFESVTEKLTWDQLFGMASELHNEDQSKNF